MASARPPATSTRLSDEETLELLEMRETMTAAAITKTPLARKYGLSRNAVVGICHRIKQATEPCPMDGTMPPGWWRYRKAHT